MSVGQSVRRAGLDAKPTLDGVKIQIVGNKKVVPYVDQPVFVWAIVRGVLFGRLPESQPLPVGSATGPQLSRRL